MPSLFALEFAEFFLGLTRHSSFREYADEARLPATTVRLHDLRHTAITNAISQGEDIMLVAAFAGHAKTSTTTDTYGHPMPKRAHEAARGMRSVSPVPKPLVSERLSTRRSKA